MSFYWDDRKTEETGENWLKSLKGRVQPKQKWSDEDEQMINDIIEAIDTPYADQELEMVTWLKSLKERYTWKHSDEQMDELKQWLNSHRDEINSLYEQLKSL